MLTQQEIFEQAASLPYEEREDLVKNLRNTLHEKNGSSHKRELTLADRKRIVDELRGIAAVPGKIPPTDEEVKESYQAYLAEKYK